MKKISIYLSVCIAILVQSGTGCNQNNEPELDVCSQLQSTDQIYDIDWIQNKANAQHLDFPNAGYGLQGVYQQNIDGVGVVYAFYYLDLNVVGGAGKHDMYFEWYNCNESFICADDGDFAINDCGNEHNLTVPVFEETIPVFWQYII